ncbi:hypothetical protein M9H77_04074 [Catharanthus roseus]|uniref:Uncharacterized protein n=1 Tax=Catharanthus roseus TaxID=4058 RepID=A0ACC0CD38_CATRO|nr:hypothetical protein M9H77_04074 [Catharanthus roseus]
MGVRLFCNRALVWCSAGIDYKMLELGSNDLVLGSELCPWSPTVALHVLLNLGIEVALMCLDSLRLSNCAPNPYISSGWLGSQQATKVLGQEFLEQISPEGHMVVFYCGTYDLVPRGIQIPYSAAVDLVVGLGVLGTLVEGPSRTTSSSSYSLREIVLEREPVPMIDLSDKEDPSEAESESDAETMPESEGVALADAKGTDTFTAGSQSPNHADEAVSGSSQNRQFEPMREATPHPEQATIRLIDTDENKTRQFVKGLKVELQRALAPLPPMGFAAAVEAATRTEMANQAVIQMKTVIGSPVTPYKRPGQ